VCTALFEFGNEPDQIGQIPSEPIQPPDNEHIAFAKALETAVQLRTFGVLSRHLFFIDIAAFGPLECVPLQVESLIVR